MPRTSRACVLDRPWTVPTGLECLRLRRRKSPSVLFLSSQRVVTAMSRRLAVSADLTPGYLCRRESRLVRAARSAVSDVGAGAATLVTFAPDAFPRPSIHPD